MWRGEFYKVLADLGIDCTEEQANRMFAEAPRARGISFLKTVNPLQVALQKHTGGDGHG